MPQDQLTLEKIAENQQKISDNQEKHNDDDAKTFAKMDKRAERHEELMQINGEHLSHLRNDLNITMSDVKELKEDIKEIKDIVLEHIKKVEPILEDYRDKEGAKRTFKKLANGGGLIASLIGAWIIIKEFLIK